RPWFAFTRSAPPSYPMYLKHTLSMSQPRLASKSNRIGPAFDFNDVDSFCVDNENAVSGASETRVIDGVASDSEISRIAAIPAAQLGNRYAMTSRFSGSRCTCTHASVITPRRPSEPRIISRPLGPEEVAGRGRISTTLPG